MTFHNSLLYPLAAFAFLPLQGVLASSTKPNILVIVADDLGYGDVQCYNPERGKIPTPNIDRLAANGMRFTDGHSSSGVCSPSRYTLLTGRYHWRSRLQAGIVGVFEKALIPPDRLTIAGLAKQNGYRTAAIGKWHLGWDWPIAPDQRASLMVDKAGNPVGGKRGRAGDDEGAPAVTTIQKETWQAIFSQPIPGGPTSNGFDSYFGTDVPNWPPYCFIENDRTVGIPSVFLPPKLFKNHLASQQGPALPKWELENILPTLGDRGVRFLTETTKSEIPFLVYLPLTAPHTPLAVNPEWKGKSGLNTYADFVMETDSVVGRVLDALEKTGTAENTLVVFTSDNGCAQYIGATDLESLGHYPSGSLRGYKSDAWEGGHRIPFIVKWPGVTKPGSVCTQLVLQADLMATFSEVMGVTLPETAGEDSFSLTPLLKGGDQPIRENAVNCSADGVPAIRKGSWKLILGSGGGSLSKGGDRTQTVQLYNLAEDLAENTNVAMKHPERVAEMVRLLEKLITDGRSTSGAPQKNDVEVRRFPKLAP